MPRIYFKMPKILTQIIGIRASHKSTVLSLLSEAKNPPNFLIEKLKGVYFWYQRPLLPCFLEAKYENLCINTR